MPPLRERLREGVENFTGLTVRDSQYVTRLEETDRRFGEFADEAEDLVENLLDFVGGERGPYESRASARRFLAAQSRRALIRDPLAGAEANLRANFAFGRGIPRPEARDKDVQEIVDRGWEHPNNKRKLTSFEAQRHRSNDLITGANLYPTVFESNGRVLLAFHEEDRVVNVVTHPDDDETPLWYVVRKTKTDWNFDADMANPVPVEISRAGGEKVYYLAHWRNVEEAERSASEMGVDPPPKPPADKILPGKAEHIRINRVGRTQFGIPPWARTLRFYSAMNQLTEAQVAMRQAAATLVAKRVRKTGPRDLFRAASNFLNRSGEIASTRFGAGSPVAAGRGTDPQAGGAPPPAGSWWLENEADRLEAVRLSSGSSEAAQDAQIVRAPIAAAAGFGQHYFGDASNANLATATSLELPSLMEVGAWQETFEGLCCFFVDRTIEAAVHAGQLGGMIAEDEQDDGRSLQELHLPEDRAELERRTGRDLSYTFEMPYPGRRNLPDVVSAVTNTATEYDPQGQNPKLRRLLLGFLFRHGFQLQDPSRAVDEVWPEDFKPEPFAAKGAAAPAEVPPGELPPDAGGDPSQQGAPGQGTGRVEPQQQMGTPAYSSFAGQMQQGELVEAQFSDEDRRMLRMLSAATEEEFAAMLADPNTFLTAHANGSKNGGAPTFPFSSS